MGYRYLNSCENKQICFNGIGFAEELEEQEQYRLMYKYINLLDERCKDLLLMYFAEKTCREMSSELKVENTEHIRKMKYKCKEKLARMIRQDPLYKEIVENRKNEKR